MDSHKKKKIWGWVIYDWANSAFVTSVMTGFFPIFFKQYWCSGVDINVSTARLGFGNSLASVFVAVLAPLLGSIADKGSAKKKFMIFFSYFGVLMTLCLFFIPQQTWFWAIFVYMLGVIGWSSANVFYDSLLPQTAEENKIDFVSGLGYGMGYLGGGLLLLFNVFMVQKPEAFGLENSAEAVRYCFVSVALWWGTFTLATLFWVKEEKSPQTLSWGKLFLQGINQIIITLKKIRKMKTISLFLLAYWFYIDGVDTIIRMAVDYGLSLGFKDKDLIFALLLVQFVGFPATIIYSKLGEKWGTRKAIFLAIGIYAVVTLGGMMMKNKSEFYILACAIALVQGGIQALSRSYYSRLIPKSQAGEFFGFYNMLGKFAVILGPLLMGSIGLFIKSLLMPPVPSEQQMVEISHLASRLSIGSILILFLIGAILLYFVKEEKRKWETEQLSTI